MNVIRPKSLRFLFAGNGGKRPKAAFLSYTPTAFGRKKKDRKTA
jgi:hypothetical protein